MTAPGHDLRVLPLRLEVVQDVLTPSRSLGAIARLDVFVLSRHLHHTRTRHAGRFAVNRYLGAGDSRFDRTADTLRRVARGLAVL